MGAPSREPLRVLVVDAHPTFADLLSITLSTEPDMTGVGTASQAPEAIAPAQQLRPDVVVMDIELPRQDGTSPTARPRVVVRRARPPP